MDYSQYQKLEKIAFELKEKSNSFFSIRKDDILDAWNSAVRQTRDQNSSLKSAQEEGYEECKENIIKFVHALNLDTNEVECFEIKAKHNFNRMQYFKINILNSLHEPIQTIRKLYK